MARNTDSFTVKVGDRIAQLVLERVGGSWMPFEHLESSLCYADLHAGNRGSGGVGGECQRGRRLWEHRIKSDDIAKQRKMSVYVALLSKYR